MSEAHEIAHAMLGWLYRWRKPEAELDPDGSTRILRYSRAFRGFWWCLACFPVALCGLVLVLLFDPQPPLNPTGMAIVAAFPVILLLGAAYEVAKAHRLYVKFDEEGFTIVRFLFRPARVAWADVRSVSLSGGEENHLVIGKERGSAKISLQMNGLGRFGLYLEQFASVELSPWVRSALPRLQLPPGQTATSHAG
jgi:hypothetical protein